MGRHSGKVAGLALFRLSASGFPLGAILHSFLPSFYELLNLSGRSC